MVSHENDAHAFAELLKAEALSGNDIAFGHFLLKGSRGVSSRIQYNATEFDLLGGKHQYTFPIHDGKLEVSLQLYQTTRSFFRLFCYTRIGEVQGMTFSINLTTAKESDRAIFLTQQLKFSERYSGDVSIARAHRQQKQLVLSSMLRRLNLDVGENNDVVLGIFSPADGQLINTTAEKFLNDFLVVSLLKGHFQGNKGYQLEVLPSYTLELAGEVILATTDQDVARRRNASTHGQRDVPLGMRYQILVRDKSLCQRCGRGPADGVRLHVDHKKPFSLGGRTELANLWALCSDCNLGKGNRHTDLFCTEVQN